MVLTQFLTVLTSCCSGSAVSPPEEVEQLREGQQGAGPGPGQEQGRCHLGEQVNISCVPDCKSSRDILYICEQLLTYNLSFYPRTLYTFLEIYEEIFFYSFIHFLQTTGSVHCLREHVGES